jgi:hypothetical protein
LGEMDFAFRPVFTALYHVVSRHHTQLSLSVQDLRRKRHKDVTSL